MKIRPPHRPLDRVTQGYCPVCDHERPLLGMIPASLAHADSIALDCGHAVEFPPKASVALRAKADGSAVMYANLDDLRRVQRREGKDGARR